ncbi:MAG: ogr/Delta-like zinc finger family protein [Cellvibrionaceae bacterium]
MLELPPVDDWENQDVRVNCPECHGVAIVSSRKEQDPKVVDLYCSCKDPMCGATFKSTLAFSHIISPSANSSKRLVLDLLKNMPKHEQQDLLAAL